MSSSVEMNSLLAQMRELKSVATQDVRPTQSLETKEAAGPQFSSMFKQAIDQVNELQATSGSLQEAYIRGDSNIDITRVMVASQKSSIAFQAVVQVRNKLVESYKDIMNMPV
ncbi:MAG: flagellar hook-basal body complex protein FliE [Pseudomonadales bacterium]|nr:flagellar hook-basal body complex protein FliE [Pseudomonadales bacterium]